MAVRVGFFEDTDQCYAEGPFVMVNAGGWRVEAGSAGTKCPTMLHSSVYRFIEKSGFRSGKHADDTKCAEVVDFLNTKVKEGVITKDQYGTWIVL